MSVRRALSFTRWCVIMLVLLSGYNSDIVLARDIPSWHPRSSRSRRGELGAPGGSRREARETPASRRSLSEGVYKVPALPEATPTLEASVLAVPSKAALLTVEPVVDHAEAFEANIVSRPGCSIQSAVVSGGTAVVKGSCNGEKTTGAALTGPTIVSLDESVKPTAAVVNAAATKRASVPWENCKVCDTCELTYPPRGDGTFSFEAKIDKDAQEDTCSECFGCTVTLQRLSEKTDFKMPTGSENKVKVFQGASGAAVLKGSTLEGPVIVKMWCDLAGEWRQTENHKPVPMTCKDAKVDAVAGQCPVKGGLTGHGQCNLRFLTALNQLTEEAGLAAITPTSWAGPVHSILPQGLHNNMGVQVHTKAQFYTVAEGVSIEAVTGGRITNTNLPLLRGLKSEQIKMAAMFDLLFSEADRHGQNVFLASNSDIQLIDNEGAFGPTNSMFLPGTQKFEIYRIGYEAVCCGNLPPGNCPGKPTASAPESLLDYRCHVPGGKMAFDYPVGVMDFLKRVEPLTARDLYEKYQMSNMQHATTLKQRTTWLLKHGFEETLDRVLAGQEPGDGIRYGFNFSYPIHPPCCDIATCNIRKDPKLAL
uniref:PI3K/PI4K catalytic domain-containing protein n=1 Tax=Pyramimonas obovata TaxID=1411642 RepID=A0A7S0QZM7_9CHLO|mmetsp:Transcript_20001/g.43767  ORF Transcript_20001/g.43767 Transcript_20001/m.43767 type:complete len:592 (+) Transcript_20001:171-1946(+)